MAERRQWGPPPRPPEYGDAAPPINPQTSQTTLHWCDGVNTACAEKGEWGLSCIPQRATTPVTGDLLGLSPANTGGCRPHSTASTTSARHTGEDSKISFLERSAFQSKNYLLVRYSRTVEDPGASHNPAHWALLSCITLSHDWVQFSPSYSQSVMLTNHLQTTFTSGKWSGREPPHF